jgi:hypothetical protein
MNGAIYSKPKREVDLNNLAQINKYLLYSIFIIYLLYSRE